MKRRELAKTYETALVQGQILKRMTDREEKVGVCIRDLPNGTKIKTGGGSEGTITGRQTRTTIQIRIDSGEQLGSYDWISKEAFVTV